MSTEDKKKIITLQKELVELLLQKANVSKKTLYNSAIRGFVNDNIDLLSPVELKKYETILL
jgi:hypothetical protein